MSCGCCRSSNGRNSAAASSIPSPRKWSGRLKNDTLATPRILADSSASRSRMAHAFLASNHAGRILRRSRTRGHVVATIGMKTDGSAATDRLVFRMGAITRIFIRHFLFPRRHYCRSANVNRQLPALTATYCLPPTEYVIGPEMIAAPREAFHSSAPLRASRA